MCFYKKKKGYQNKSSKSNTQCTKTNFPFTPRFQFTHQTLVHHKAPLQSWTSQCRCLLGKHKCQSRPRPLRRSAGCWAGTACCYGGAGPAHLSPIWPAEWGCHWPHTPTPAAGLWSPWLSETLVGKLYERLLKWSLEKMRTVGVWLLCQCDVCTCLHHSPFLQIACICAVAEITPRIQKDFNHNVSLGAFISAFKDAKNCACHHLWLNVSWQDRMIKLHWAGEWETHARHMWLQ